MTVRRASLALLIGALLLLGSCGGGSNSAPPPPPPNLWDSMTWDQGSWG
jgi:hypothetical protein